MSLYSTAVSDYFERYPEAQQQWLDQANPARIKQATAHELSQLSATSQAQLAAGHLVLSPNSTYYFLPLRQGTVLYGSTDMLPVEIAEPLAYALVGLAILVAVFLWTLFHWRELQKLERAATRFGQGDLATRANISANSNIAGLAQRFDEMAARIENSIQQQRDMMNGISHELKTPLARLAFGIALLHEEPSPIRQQERQANLLKDVHELDELVTELLSLSRLEQGASLLKLIEVDIRQLLDSVAAGVAADLAHGPAKLRLDYAHAPQLQVCDPTLLARALQNLVRNGARYAATEIVLSAQPGGKGHVHFIVEDDGPGIPATERSKVFEPFYRLDQSRDRHTGGSGLGLAIVRRVALVHGGDIALDDSPLGGARFSLILPAY